METNMDSTPEKLRLRTEVGLMGGVSLITGVMIGSGIFMSPQTVLMYIESPGASLLIWACSGLLAMLASLSYAELGTVIRDSGGEYIYILRTSGNLMAFVFAFSSIVVVRPASTSGIALSFGQNAVAPFYEDCDPPAVVVKSAAAVAILLLTIVNCMNVRCVMAVSVILMAAKFVALVVLCIGGIVILVQGNTANFQNMFEGTNQGISAIGMAFYQCLWSYDGWNTLNTVTEELKRPEVNLMRALMIAVPLVTIFYLLVNVSYLTVMTPREMILSNAVAVTWGNKVLGRWSWLMSVAAALSSFGCLNASFFSGGRVCFVAAREGHMPRILAMAHVRRFTPAPALIFTTIISFIVLIPGDFHTIINYMRDVNILPDKRRSFRLIELEGSGKPSSQITPCQPLLCTFASLCWLEMALLSWLKLRTYATLCCFTEWIFYGITIAGLLYLKFYHPDLPRAYRVPVVIPILVLLASVFLVLAPIIDDPQIEYLYLTLLNLSGVLLYFLFVHLKLFPSLMDKLTTFLQLILEVAPADKNV